MAAVLGTVARASLGGLLHPQVQGGPHRLRRAAREGGELADGGAAGPEHPHRRAGGAGQPGVESLLEPGRADLVGGGDPGPGGLQLLGARGGDPSEQRLGEGGRRAELVDPGAEDHAREVVDAVTGGLVVRPAQRDDGTKSPGRARATSVAMSGAEIDRADARVAATDATSGTWFGTRPTVTVSVGVTSGRPSAASSGARVGRERCSDSACPAPSCGCTSWVLPAHPPLPVPALDHRDAPGVAPGVDDTGERPARGVGHRRWSPSELASPVWS